MTDLDARFAPFAQRMHDAGMPPLATATFRAHYAALLAGETGEISEESIRPVPELPDADGEPMGYEEVRRVVAEAPGTSPEELIEALLVAAEKWAGSGPPNDDITFVALRAR